MGPCRRYLALCLTSCQFVSAFLFFVYVTRRRTSSYGVARLVQIAPLTCWRNSTPFLCKASFCTMKTDHFRPELLTTRSCFSGCRERNSGQYVTITVGLFVRLCVCVC